MPRYKATPSLRQRVGVLTVGPSPPAASISTVCVDVRELLRHAAAASSASPDARGTHTSEDVVQAPDISQPMHPASREAPPTKLSTSPSRLEDSTFWAPSYPPMGGFAIHSGPPPLSPTDATILHAILTQPPPRTTPVPQLSPSSSGAPEDVHVPRQPSLANNSKKHFAAPISSARAIQAADPSEALCGAHSSAVHSVSSLSKSAERGALGPPSLSLSAPRARQSHSPTAENTSGATCIPPHGASRVPIVELSPAVQETVQRLLQPLHQYNRSKALLGSWSASETPLHPLHSVDTLLPTSTRPSEAVQTPEAPLPSTTSPCAVTFIARKAEGPPPNGRFSAELIIDDVPKNSPALPAAAPTAPNARPGKGLGRLAPAAALKHNTAGAEGLAGIHHTAEPFRWSATTARRTVPPTFRRQLQFLEGVPTTRRPKRK